MAETLPVVDMLDAIGSDSAVIPKGTKRVAAYITGSGGIAWSAAQIAALASKGVQRVVRIDQSNIISALTSVRVLVKDIEPGASTNLTADHEAVLRAKLGLRTTLYCMLSDFDALKASVAAFGIQAHVDYWVADWNLDRNGAVAFLVAHPEVAAVQWASPTSNPRTLVPGSRLTLAQANVDLSVTRANWPAPLPPPAKKKVSLPHVPLPPRPHVKITAAGLAGAVAAAVLAYANAHGAHLTRLDGSESALIDLAAALLAGYLVPVKKK